MIDPCTTCNGTGRGKPSRGNNDERALDEDEAFGYQCQACACFMCGRSAGETLNNLGLCEECRKPEIEADFMAIAELIDHVGSVCVVPVDARGNEIVREKREGDITIDISELNMRGHESTYGAAFVELSEASIDLWNVLTRPLKEKLTRLLHWIS